jgi:hypothetical protein
MESSNLKEDEKSEIQRLVSFSCERTGDESVALIGIAFEELGDLYLRRGNVGTSLAIPERRG